MADALVNGVGASALVPPRLRRFLYGVAGLPRNVQFPPGCHFVARRLTIESGYVNRGVLFDSSAPIAIGRRVFIGPNVQFITTTHDIGGSSQRASTPRRAAPIIVGDGCWIGANAVILAGVTIASGSIVAAGAVVASSTEPDGLYGGVPARRIRDLPDS